MDWELWLVACGIAGLVLLLIVAPVILLTRKPRAPRPRHPPRSWPHMLAGCVVLLVGMVLPVGLAAAVGGPYGCLLGFLLVGLVIRYYLVSRETAAAQVFSTIGASMRQNLPLPAALELEAAGGQENAGRAMRRISHWLSQGYPLSEAIRRGYPRCPGYAVAMVAAAERIHQAPQAVAAVEAHLARKGREGRKFQPVNPAYPLFLVLLSFSILWGLAQFVVPSFKVISADIGGRLPAVTRGLLAAFEASRGAMAVVLGLLVLGVIPAGVYLKFRARRPERPYLLSRIGDFLKWHMPVLHWFERNFALMQTVSFLRLSLGAGGTVDEAITGAGELDVNGCYRRRLGDWLARVQRGEDVAAAAKTSRIGAAVTWAFDTKVNQGNTPAILETLESFYRSSYGYAANLARFIFWPCVTIAMGLMVGLMVYALFAPLVALYEHMTQGVIP